MRQFWFDAAKMTNEELADLIHELNDELDARSRALAGSWLRRQLDGASLEVRSWSTSKQRSMKVSL